ncbi:MAG: protein translocase subunit SecD [Clostridia bacterium]|nr:protein translocase subunit SecD [Clostridia bacterium]MBQ4248892.1 protein translocase subunit SecD [Clostridia bacterium]
MGKTLPKFVVTLIVIAILAYIALAGIYAGNFMIPSVFDTENGIRKGLDLVGGSVITYEAQIEESMSPDELSTSMDSVVSMMRQRLNSLGLYEADITKVGDRRVRIEIPSIDDPEEAVQKLGSTAQLVFCDYQGNVFLTGSDVVSAKSQYGQTQQNGTSQYYVSLTFTQDAAKIFAEETDRISKLPQGQNIIAILMDGEVVSSASVSYRIDSESCVIESPTFTAEETTWLADIITAGQLPFALKDVELRSVGPQLGERALETSLWAGLIGLILVAVIMIVFYRIQGLMSVIALVAYVAIVGIIISVFRFNLSLPSIAGIILSIGMAVDANVIIFERVKEEIRFGKSVKASVESGFKRAFKAILDANITTLIAAFVLWQFGTGSIQGFAITLFVGVIVSLITALIITRILLKCMVGFGVTNHKLYGA